MTALVHACPDIIALTISLIMIYLLRANRVVSAAKTKTFLAAVSIMVIVICTEIASVFVDFYGSASENVLDSILYTIIYITGPIVAVMLASLFDKGIDRLIRPLIIAFVTYVLFVLANLFTGWLFTVTGDTEYARGPFFPIYLIFVLAAFLLIIWANVKSIRKRTVVRWSLIIIAYAIIVVFALIEVFFPDALLAWAGVSLALLVYYIYLREMQFTFDALTGALNRGAFIKAMDGLERRPGVCLIMCDLDRLKKINDCQGHEQGDVYLRDAVTLMKECLGDAGIVYRIGGDEFCIICRDVPERMMNRMLEKFAERIRLKCETAGYDFGISFGYAFRRDLDEDLFETLSHADMQMYDAKERAHEIGRYYHR